jgi:hypothetical protein
VSHSVAAGVKDFANRSRKITDASTRHDDRVPASVRFLGDPEKSSAIVFAKLHVKTLSLYLEFFRVDDAVHFPEKQRSLGRSAYRVEEKSAAL